MLRAVARGSRDLRIDGVFGDAAHRGNWNPDGSGSGAEPDTEHGGGPGAAAGFGGSGLRARGGVRIDATDRQLSVWSEGVGSDGLFLSSSDPGGRRAGCGMVTRIARE